MNHVFRLQKIAARLGLLIVAFSAQLGLAQNRVNYARQDPYRGQEDRARQALLHTATARRASEQPLPRGYRPKHEVFQAQYAGTIEPDPLPIESPLEDGGAYDGGAYMDDGGIVDMQPDFPGDGVEAWDSGWGNDVIADDGCYGDNGCVCDSCLQDPTVNELGPFRLGGPVFNLQNASIYAGVQGFTGSAALGSTGSFGFHEGFNLGIPLAIFPATGIGAQIGLRTVQSNLNGADFTTRERNQTFFTVGGFRRATCGVEAGLVVDMMRDRWYDRVDLTQLRGQLSWKFPERHEWGYWFTAHTNDDTSVSPITNQIDTWKTTSLHAFFYRRRGFLTPGGELMMFAGGSADKDGLIGTTMFLPMNNALALQTEWTYLTPNEGTLNGGTQNESWNVGLSLVWRLGMDARCTNPSYYRPMFDVANNGTLMVDQQP